MSRLSPGIRSRLLPWSLCSLLLQAFLCTADHPAQLPCNEQELASEFCTTSGRQSLLQVTRSSYVKARPEANVFDNGDAIVDEALADLESNSVPGMLSELKDSVSATEFFTENEGTDGKKSSDNSDASQSPSEEPESVGSEKLHVENLLAKQPGKVSGKAANASAEQPEKVPGCTPTCKWTCTEPVCEEECEPLCTPGKCETRCSTMHLAGCKLGCEQPECATVCPKNHCAKDGCPKCITNCSQPLCKLRCPQKQNCTSVCETPTCEWQCQKPQSCPKPKCKLECDVQTKDCAKSVHKEMPALKKGEIKVASFVPPSSLLQMSNELTAAEKSNHQREVLHLRATAEAMYSEASQVSRFVIELPLAS